MTAVSDDDLTRLLRALDAQPREATPPVRLVPEPDESVAGWLGEVTSVRSRADEGAVRHRERVDAASRTVFGTTASDLLDTHGIPLHRAAISVTVPRGAQLADLVPRLAGVAPVGPPSPGAQDDVVRVAVTAHPDAEVGIVRLHGGAFWMGGGAVASTIDRALVDHIAQHVRAAVFDVDYRLAPEHPYPAAIIDTLTVLDAVRRGLAGTSVRSLGLVGTSSGANTAALAARADALREPPALPVSALALIVPSMLLSDGPPALRDDPVAWELRRTQLRGYLGDAVDPADPWVSPGAGRRISELPPVFAAVAEYDDVAWGADAFRDAVCAGGGAVDLRTYPMTHVTATPRVEAAVARDLTEYLRSRLS